MVPRRSHRGFTLLEVISAVAVIALLLGLLVPSMGRAREEGRSALCAATLHNAALATTLYVDDHDGAFWPYYVDLPGEDGGRRWWFGFEPGGPAYNGTQDHRRLDKAAGFLGPYLTGTASDFRCPSFPYGAGRYFPKFSPNAGGYGYNAAALGGFDAFAPGAAGPRRMREFAGRTADVFVLADGIHFDRLDYSSTPPLEQTFNEPPYIQWRPPSFFGGNVGINGGFGHFRHNGRANVLYLDGHVGGQPPRRPLHPYSGKGLGPVANLSDDWLRVREITMGSLTMEVDLIYGLE
ncbi:MAG: prepilin-type N-terminal cleavage/methylation domain-containing protein [Phycisphaerae bacterium]